jgi:hypothetical protein
MSALGVFGHEPRKGVGNPLFGPHTAHVAPYFRVTMQRRQKIEVRVREGPEDQTGGFEDRSIQRGFQSVHLRFCLAMGLSPL